MIPLSIGFNLEKFCCFILLYVEMLIVVVSFELFCYPYPPDSCLNLIFPSCVPKTHPKPPLEAPNSPAHARENYANPAILPSHFLHTQLSLSNISYPSSHELIPIYPHADLTVISMPTSHLHALQTPPYPFLVFHATHAYHSSLISYITIHHPPLLTSRPPIPYHHLTHP